MQKTRAKLNALARVSCYINPDKRRLILNAFFLSQLINWLHARCLKISRNTTSSPSMKPTLTW